MRKNQEIKEWRSFQLNGVTYDLSHLNACDVIYVDDRNPEKKVTYNFSVTFGLHCFTETDETLSPEESDSYMCSGARGEKRHFNLKRYELSKHLPEIIRSLATKVVLVFHGGHGKFAAAKVVDSQGVEIQYFLAFAAFRERKKLRIHIQSAYQKEALGKIKKINIFSIASKLRKGEKPPKPPK